VTPFSWFETYLDVCGSVQVGAMWQCPSHADSFPSLSLQEGEDGRVLLHCHGGCVFEEVIEALGLNKKRLFEAHILSPAEFFGFVSTKPEFAEFEWRQGSSSRGDSRMKWGNASIESVTYHQFNQYYRMKRLRFSDGNKQCVWECRDGVRWVQGGVRGILHTLPLYKHQLVRAGKEARALIVLCESESSVDALVESKVVATTWAGGCSTPQMDKLKESLSGADVLYVADNDPPGLRCLSKLERELAPIVNSWAVLIGEPGEDARDLLIRGALDNLKLSALPDT
jgi:hypothetical protein